MKIAARKAAGRRHGSHGRTGKYLRKRKDSCFWSAEGFWNREAEEYLKRGRATDRENQYFDSKGTDRDAREDKSQHVPVCYRRNISGADSGLMEEKMSVNLIFKIAAVGILVTVISQVLKHSGREEHAFLTSLAGLLIVLFWIVPYIYDLFETMKSLFSL